MTPLRWYLAAAAALALITVAGIDLAVVSTREPHRRVAVPAATRPAPSTSEIVPSTPSPTPTPTLTPAPTPTLTPTPHPMQTAPRLAADSISIPSQHVVAPIDMCTIIAGGLIPPDDVRRTCYWAGGAPLTAAAGTTVITGHNVSIGNGKGAFGNLVRLKAGDAVFTSGATAKVTRWRVVSVTSRPKSAGIDPAAFVGRAGPRRLYLITGGGAFDAAQGSYVDNIYVLATV
jgi:hypothetical protein